VPDSAVDAMARYLREANANVGGSFATSRATERVIGEARETVARFLGATVDEIGFGPNMTT
jgi:selenocysteine lyase/cysteine desulfurase